MDHALELLALIGGVALTAAVLRDAFETMILPRRLNSRFRITRAYFRGLWPIWSWLAERLPRGRKRESALSMFGPLSMLVLFVAWAAALILSFALIYYGAGSPLQAPGMARGFGMDLYLSSSGLLTLGLGAATTSSAFGRALTIVEGGVGFGFVAIVIAYLPTLYGGFSRRETSISMLDARAGSPPSASELLRRHARTLGQLEAYLAEWERWSAELLESHISYPVLGYFRSQHVNQSWVAALTAVLDSCALLMAGTDDGCTHQAGLTFAMARHAVVDLAQIFIARLPRAHTDRLPEATLRQIEERLKAAGLPLRLSGERAERLAELRHLYEPQVLTIARYLRLELPLWLGDPDAKDNWQRSPWDRGAKAGAWAKGVLERHY
jgi:ABC-type transport system involved in multi-copper enzyme maturation permease subunit